MRTGKRVVALIIMTALGFGGVARGPAGAEGTIDYFEAGEFALRTQRWDRAIEFLTKAIEEKPGSFIAYHQRAVAHFKKGEQEKSISDLKTALGINPNYSDAYGLLGRLYEVRQDYGAALEVYREALRRESRPDARRLVEKQIQEVEAKIKKR